LPVNIKQAGFTDIAKAHERFEIALHILAYGGIMIVHDL
jgi:hypothetical protein